AEIRGGKGLLGRLVYDEELGEDVSTAVSDFQTIVADIKDGKGTLGKLVTDDELHNNLSDMLKSFRRSSEEVRENAPILTFSGFLFNTF
ncbi:MAG: hypothetical protein ACYTDX_09205, partial [Planctomycetota bacterium]